MPITQTSLKSKNYNALGIDEIADDISNIITVVNAIPESPITAIVNITSAQILAMGSVGIELLPAPGVNAYYDIEKVIFEYTYATTAYTYPIGDFPYVAGPSGGQLALKELLTLTQNYVATSRALNPIDAINGAIVAVIDELNQGVYLTMWDGGDPTLGDGTMRAIITYTVRTFGA